MEKLDIAYNEMAYPLPLGAVDELANICTHRQHLLDAGLGIDLLQNLCHGLSKRSGWWKGIDVTDKNVLGTKIALIHSEVSEALEGIRKDTKDSHLTDRPTVEVELADAVIRIMDLAGAMKLDLAGSIIRKLAYNQSRADHKRENREKNGGKKI